MMMMMMMMLMLVSLLDFKIAIEVSVKKEADFVNGLSCDF